PITEEHRYKMIPAQKRGTYSAIRALSFNFAQLIARLGIILGVLMNALGMTIYMALILTLGSILLYRAVYQFNLKANNENH
ncbi:MFS transporter, partial [Staphylococcus capitis]